MSSSSDNPHDRQPGPPMRNVPSPAGSKNVSKAGNAYTRFIPREELGDVTSWMPGSLDRRAAPRDGHPPAQAAARPAAPAEPTAAEWQARITAARQAGYADGYRDGLTALESFKQSFATQATAQIGALVEALDAQFAALDHRVAQTLAGVAAQLARQVLRTELEVRPEVLAAVATEAVNAVMLSARHISLHVHPADLPLVAEGAEEALKARGARLLPDPSLQRGDVRVVSDVGTIDARIATRWAQAAAAIGVDPAWPQAEAEPTR